MNNIAIIDTSAIIAYLNKKDKYHLWIKNIFMELLSPLLTCESVMTETMFLMGKLHGGISAVFDFIDSVPIFIPFNFENERKNLRELMKKYENLPMSLADACLVRMSEIYTDSFILTIDEDFKIYRKNIKEKIPLIIPE